MPLFILLPMSVMIHLSACTVKRHSRIAICQVGSKPKRIRFAPPWEAVAHARTWKRKRKDRHLSRSPGADDLCSSSGFSRGILRPTNDLPGNTRHSTATQGSQSCFGEVMVIFHIMRCLPQSCNTYLPPVPICLYIYLSICPPACLLI